MTKGLTINVLKVKQKDKSTILTNIVEWLDIKILQNTISEQIGFITSLKDRIHNIDILTLLNLNIETICLLHLNQSRIIILKIMHGSRLFTSFNIKKKSFIKWTFRT